MDPISNIINISYLGQILLLILISLIVVVGLIYGFIYLSIIWLKFHDREEKSLKSVLLSISLPRENELKIDVAEQMFASLFSLGKSGFKSKFKAQEHISFEIVDQKEDIRFYICVNQKIRDLVEKQINGAYPGAEIKETDEYNIFSKTGKIAFASLKLKSVNYQPIKVYKELPTDPLSSLTSALAKMQDEEGAVVQLIISPTGKEWQTQGKSYISQTKKAEADPEKAKYNIDPKELEQIENKCIKPGFETNINIVVSAQDKDKAENHLNNIVGTFSQFASDLNGFSQRKYWFKKSFMTNFIYRYPAIFGSKSILSSEELATIFHLPNKTIETPHIYWLSAKSAPAPAQIPQTGLYLGKSVYRGMTRPVFISDEDRRRHMYIIGKTGTGKSELMSDMILQDIRAGRGVCFIDPHDTIEKILELIPPERAEDVIYFDPSDTQRPMGLNMLEAKTE